MSEHFSPAPGSLLARLAELMASLGFEPHEVIGADHPSKTSLVFRSFPFRGDLAARRDQLDIPLFTTLTVEDSESPPASTP